MHNKVLVKTYPAPPVDRDEILRYAGCKGGADTRTEALLNGCLKESENAFSYRVCFLVTEAKTLIERLGGARAGSLACTRLCNAEYAAVFAATIGLEIDRQILREGALSPAKAVLLQAIGTERIESLCDCFCKELKDGCEKRGYCTGARFSAGYGDFPITVQREIFSLLDCERKIGLTLNDSLLMSPTKSVTAIVPIGKRETDSRQGCAVCEKGDCPFKK